MKLQLQPKPESDGDFGDQITSKMVFEVEVLSVEHRDSKWFATDYDTNERLLDEDGQPYKKKEFNFKFGIVEEGAFKGKWVWGSTSDYFRDTAKCKLANWIKAILDEPVLPEGFTIDPEEDLKGMRCRVVVNAKKRDDGSYSNWVEDVLPTKGGGSPQQRVQEHLAQNEAPEEPAYDPDNEPF